MTEMTEMRKRPSIQNTDGPNTVKELKERARIYEDGYWQDNTHIFLPGELQIYSKQLLYEYFMWQAKFVGSNPGINSFIDEVIKDEIK